MEFSLPPMTPSPEAQASDANPIEVVASAAATAVSREIYRRGLLSAAWDVGPQMATQALRRGVIQRTLVWTQGERDGSAGGAADGGDGGDIGDGMGDKEEEVLQALRRLSGKDGLRVRRDGMSRWGIGGGRFTEVLFPVAVRPPVGSG